VSTKARRKFEQNAEDVAALLAIHTFMGGERPGRRNRNLEALNKAGIVLVSAIWEAYCEDLAEEALGHLIKHTKTPDALPKALRQIVAREVKADKNDLSPWTLAGDGWKALLTKRTADLREQRNRALNTPKADNIDGLLAETIGIPGASSSWHWNKMLVATARTKLDEYLTLRGDIAHRGAAAKTVRKSQVEDFVGHVFRLVEKTDAAVNEFALKESSVALC
jgi:HEPN superfamily RiboL-PSP-like protein